MNRLHVSTALSLACCLIGGCSSDNMSLKVDFTIEEGADVDPAATLRFDVRAAEAVNASGDEGPLPQSFGPVVANTPQQLDLQRSVSFTGQVTGDLVAPWRSADLPYITDVVTGSLAIRRPFTAQSYNTRLNVDGTFALQAVAGSDYVLSVSTDDPNMPPLSTFIDIAADPIGQVIALPSGAPVWGVVTDGSGAPIPGVRLRVVLADGTTGGTTITDAQGRYLLRAPVGAARIESLGRNNGRDPTVQSGLFEVSESGLTVDLPLGDLGLVSLSGRLVTESGAPIQGSTVRITPISLNGYDAYTVTSSVSVTTTATGTFDVQVPSGVYRIELLPRTSDTVSSLQLGDVVVGTATALGELTLPAFTLTTFSIGGPEAGNAQVYTPIGDARIACVEVGLGRRSWTTFTDGSGKATMPLPQNRLLCTLTPPGARGDLAMTIREIDPTDDDAPVIDFETGARVYGQVLTQGQVEPYAVIEIRDGAGVLWAAGISDDRGTFSLQLAWPQQVR